MKNRFLLFMWPQYESIGGFNDFIDGFEYLSDAQKTVKKIYNDDKYHTLDQYHIVDIKIYEIIEEGWAKECQ